MTSSRTLLGEMSRWATAHSCSAASPASTSQTIAVLRSHASGPSSSTRASGVPLDTLHRHEVTVALPDGGSDPGKISELARRMVRYVLPDMSHLPWSDRGGLHTHRYCAEVAG
jgi:hypothetical protein